MRRWVRLLGSALDGAARHKLLVWAAATSFYFLFAFFPTVLLAASALSAVHLGAMHDKLLAAVAQNLPSTAAAFVTEQLDALVQQHAGGLVSFSTGVLVFAASKAFFALMEALNAAYECPETRSAARRLWLSLLLALSAGIFIALALAAILLGRHLLEILVRPLPGGLVLLHLWPLFRWGATVGLMMLALLLLYRFAPSAPPPRAGRLQAVVVALSLWLAASAGLAFYLDRFPKYAAIYGSLGAVIALMTWFYLGALVILFGAELHSAWLRQHWYS